jgi:hypothetical protein
LPHLLRTSPHCHWKHGDLRYTMDLSQYKSLLRQSVSKCTSFVIIYRRILLLLLFILPLNAYLFAWMLSTTDTFFPRPLRTAKEVMLVVAHPDDECIQFCISLIQRCSLPPVCSGRYGVGTPSVICLCCLRVFPSTCVPIAGNNYGMGETRKHELHEACKTLGIDRRGRCVVVDHPSQPFLSSLMVEIYKTIRGNGGIPISSSRSF